MCNTKSHEAELEQNKEEQRDDDDRNECESDFFYVRHAASYSDSRTITVDEFLVRW